MRNTFGRLLAATALVALGATVAAAEAPDPENGADVFKKCRACHQIGEGAKNAVGPELNGVIGRKAGSAPGFNYTDANKHSGLTWDEATFTKYIKNPRAVVPGTKMAFAGLKDDLDIQDLIAFLKQYDASGKKVK
ncbi:MAG: c-type cytochrome [Hyphomicrobiaceae bacterium]